MFDAMPWKTGRWLVLALAAMGLLAWGRGVVAERNALRDWQASVVLAVAAETPADRRATVTARTTIDEIQWLGREYRTASIALARQSALLAQAQRAATEAQNAAAIARKQAATRNPAREAVRIGLEAPRRAGGLTQAEWDQL